MVKEEFKDIESQDGGGLNLIVNRDTQSSRKLISGGKGDFFLTFGFKDAISCVCFQWCKRIKFHVLTAS